MTVAKHGSEQELGTEIRCSGTLQKLSCLGLWPVRGTWATGFSMHEAVLVPLSDVCEGHMHSFACCLPFSIST